MRSLYCFKLLSAVAAAAGWLAGSAGLANNDVWKTAASGTWGAGASWVDGSTPVFGDEATFNLPGAYTVSFDANPGAIRELNLTNAANVTFASDSRPPSPILPRTLPVTSVTGSGDVSISFGATLTLGAVGDSRGPRPLHLTIRDELTVNGVLNVRFGSDVNVNNSALRITGQLNVSGSGSTVTSSASQSTFFGGSTNVSAGGLMQTGASSIAGEVGAVTVSGNGSRWISSGLIQVGQQLSFQEGHGALSVTGGGLVESANARLGDQFGTTGAVTVTDSGSLWNTTSVLDIGLFGPGTVNIQPGGTATVGHETVIWPQGRLRLQGGTFDTRDFSIQGGGQFEWTAGTLRVGAYHGDLVQPTGILAPGHSAGSTTVLGNYTQQSAGTLEIEIGGAAQGTEYDVVNVAGDVLLGGRLDLKLINGFVPTPSQTFVILSTSTSMSGAFNNAASGQRLTTADGGGSFLVNYGAGSAFDPTLIVLSSFRTGGLPGDFDEDGDVDGDDLTRWKSGFGAAGAATHTQGDADGDLDVDGADFLAWQRQLGGAAIMASNSQMAPEPPSAVLAVAILIAAIAGRGWRA